ncbi:plasminogen-like [Branchiostoma floridae x Branchiostoma japonicum]
MRVLAVIFLGCAALLAASSPAERNLNQAEVAELENRILRILEAVDNKEPPQEQQRELPEGPGDLITLDTAVDGMEQQQDVREGEDFRFPETSCHNGNGESYRGTVSVTGTGKPCQRWDSQSPHKHSRTPAKYPNAGLGKNYCRNPDGSSGLWCYTTHPGTRWEFCDVPQCKKETCQKGDGSSYRGTASVTESGKTCQRWDSQTPHPHRRTPDRYLHARLLKNYCRNPDGASGLWCYTTDPRTRWEYCDVPACPGKGYICKMKC